MSSGAPPAPTWLRAWQDQNGVDPGAELPGWWRCCAQAAIRHLSRLQSPWDCYSLSELGVPDPPEGASWSSVVSAAASKGWIRSVGKVPSRRPGGGSTAVHEWVGHAVPDETVVAGPDQHGDLVKDEPVRTSFSEALAGFLVAGTALAAAQAVLLRAVEEARVEAEKREAASAAIMAIL